MTAVFRKIHIYLSQTFTGLQQVKYIKLSTLWKVFSLMPKKEKIFFSVSVFICILSMGSSLRLWYLKNTVEVPAQSGEITEGILGRPQYINPLLAQSEADMALTKLVFSGLLTYDHQGNLLPELAESMPKISEDQKSYTVKIRSDIKWHDGTPLTAEDVIFTVETIKNNQTKAALKNIWQSTQLEKLSDHEIKFTTKDISGPFIHNLTLPIISKNFWQNGQEQDFLTSENNLKAIGSGLYAIQEIKKLGSGKITSILFKAAKRPQDLSANLEFLNIKFYDLKEDLVAAFQSGEIDNLGLSGDGENPDLNKQKSEKKFITLPLPQYQILFYNLAKNPTNETAVRTAIDLIINKNQILEKVYENQALTSSGIIKPKAIELFLGPDIEKAKNILEKAEWQKAEDGFFKKKGQILEIELVSGDSTTSSKTSQVIAENLQNFGIKVHLQILPLTELSSKYIRPRNFSVALLSQKQNPDPDPFAFWHSSQIKDPGLNISSLQNPNIDKLITEARTTTDQPVRNAKYEELEKTLENLKVATPIVQNIYTYAISKKIQGSKLSKIYSPEQRLCDIKNWYIKTKRIWK